MTDNDSPEPGRISEAIAERVLALAEKNPERRARLIERWAGAEAWTRLEGIALAWTLDPKSLAASEASGTKPKMLPEEAKFYFDLACRSSHPEMTRDRVDPQRFIAWAHGVGLAFHADWHRAADRAGSRAVRSGAPQSGTDRNRAGLIAAWARAPYWSPEESAVLAYDLDPKEAIQHSVTGYDGPSIRSSEKAGQLFKLARRAIEIGDLDAQPSPIAFIRWARSIGIEFHSDWWDAVVDEKVPSNDQAEVPLPAATPDLQLGTKERETLLKMVAGMAIAGYRWDPKALRSDATAEIAADLRKLGAPLDADTIRKWLKRGVELVPGRLL
jgi:hypothetical protein